MTRTTMARSTTAYTAAAGGRSRAGRARAAGFAACLLGLLSATSPALAQFDTIHGVSKLSEETSPFLNLAFGDRFANGLASIGDVTFDGVGDLAVGAPGDSTVYTEAGAIWITALNPDGSELFSFRIELDYTVLQEDAGLGAAVATFEGASGNPPGDPSESFYIVAGEPFYDDSQIDQGAIQIITIDRSNYSFSTKRITFGTDAFTQNPTAGQYFGTSVDVIGDVDNNGFADLAVGATGIATGGTSGVGGVYILLMGSSASVIGYSRIDAATGISAPVADFDLIGSAVAGIGDVDGNMVPDIAVTAPGDDASGMDQGAVRLVYLASDGTVDGSRRIDGDSVDFVGADGQLADGDFFGTSISAGDIDGNGTLELVVGAGGDSGLGAFWILKMAGIVVVDADRVGAETAGFGGDVDSMEGFTAEVEILPDLDGDALGEIAVGHPYDDDGGGAGAAWVFFFGTCGDGTAEAGEQCDDGARENGDCCTAGCLYDDENALCTDDGESCTFDMCDATGTCLHVGRSGECTDGVACNGADMCEPTSGTCSIHEGDQCLAGAECQTACDPVEGACQNPSGTPCTDDGNPCTDDVCNGGGACTHPPNFAPCDDGNPCTGGDVCNDAGACSFNEDANTDGVPCSDGDGCTVGDVCAAKVCVPGGPKDCSAFADACNTASCNPDTGICSSIPVADMTPCNDGSLCTTDDECQAGVCEGADVDCSAFASMCKIGVCNLADGTCFAANDDDGTTCNDGLACTTDDECAAGVCGGTPVDCSSLDDQCHDGVCNAGTGICEQAAVGNGTSCNDGLACTTSDVCTAGVCGGTAVDCSSAADDCNTAACNPADGTCVKTPVADMTACDDGDLCTENDQCTAGICAGTAVDCSAFDAECKQGVCDPADGTCHADDLDNGTLCDDGVPCTENDECTAGVCGGTAVDCSASADQCNSGACNAVSGVCEKVPVAGNPGCNDGLACTTSDVCTAGTCAGTPVDCSGLSDFCNTGTCDPGSGSCVATPVADTTPCNDGDLCTFSDQCTAGVCAGTAVDCSSFDSACTIGVCGDGVCSAAPRPDTTPCNDGLACTQNDQCTAGVCGGTAIDCSGSADQCNSGACNAVSGLCEKVPLAGNPGCDDGQPCTVGDVCTAGVCGGSPKDCSGISTICADGVCNVATGECVLQNLEGADCNDGNLCTDDDHCSGGVCAGTAKDCSGSGDQCNAGVCDLADGGCKPSPLGGDIDCNDGSLCTGNDKCSAGVCQGTPVDCNEVEDECHTAECNVNTGACDVTTVPNDTPCNDGLSCTVGDKCTGGVCAGTAIDCSSEDDQCNEGVCNPVTGACEAQPLPDTTPCDDGLFCTELDSCQSGVCTGENPCGTAPLCGDTCNEEMDECRQCGAPYDTSRCVVNAVYILQGAVGLRECELCFCDVNGSFEVTATDAAGVLRRCVNLPQELNCPTGNVLQ